MVAVAAPRAGVGVTRREFLLASAGGLAALFAPLALAESPDPWPLLAAAGGLGLWRRSGPRSRSAIRLMHLADSSFFEALRRKLHWRGANV